MRAFQLEDAEIFDLLRLSTIVEVKKERGLFLVKRRALEKSPDSSIANLFGYNI